MSIAIGIATLVGVAAITPGPNNVAVMAAAARRGFTGALPAIAGVVSGSVVMVLVAVAGLGSVLAAHPAVGVLMSIAGCAYLCFLGAGMFASARVPGPQRAAHRPTRGDGVRLFFAGDLAGLFVFQFLNPKGWAMVLTAVASAQATQPPPLVAAWVSAIFLVVPTLCLSAWALSGALLSRRLERPRFRQRFDRVMGVTLIVSALLLLGDAGRTALAALGEISR